MSTNLHYHSLPEEAVDQEFKMVPKEIRDKYYYVPKEEASECAYIIWRTSDVLSQAEERGIEIDEDDATEIIEHIEKEHDCDFGVNWATIDFHLDEYKQGLEHEQENRIIKDYN